MIDLSAPGDTALLFTTSLLLFLVLLPMLNAVADYVSVAATRHFLHRIAARRIGTGGVMIGLALDIVIATGCLAGLLWLIPQTLDLWAQLSPLPLQFDWRLYRDTICGGDWQQGTMLWLMLATTLAPTALHLTAGAGAVAAHSARLDAQIDAILRPALTTRETTHHAIPDKGDGALARELLTADDRETLQALLARKETAALAWSVTLFVAFMAALIWAVVALAQTYALPIRCPAP